MTQESYNELQTALKDAGLTKEYVDNKLYDSLKGWVYIIRCNEYYKIGTSFISPRSRLLSMQTGNPYPLELVFSIKLPHCQKAESILHRQYRSSGNHIRGEWFSLSKIELARLTKALKQYEQIKANRQTV